MAIAFDENACFIATTISCEIMPALKGLNAIMAPFYGRVCPSAFMVIHDLLFPIAHAVVPGRKRFFPLPYADQKVRIIQQRFQPFSAFFIERLRWWIQQPMARF